MTPSYARAHFESTHLSQLTHQLIDVWLIFSQWFWRAVIDYNRSMCAHLFNDLPPLTAAVARVGGG